jgi:hypothetical protein
MTHATCDSQVDLAHAPCQRCGRTRCLPCVMPPPGPFFVILSPEKSRIHPLNWVEDATKVIVRTTDKARNPAFREWVKAPLSG